MRGVVLGGVLLLTIFLANISIPALGADLLLPSDFSSESFMKTVDFYDYARAYASFANITGPPDQYHAYVYMTYVNTSGLQMIYGGLCNVTHDETSYLTIPMQSLILHYKSEDHNRDVLASSNFLMLLAFNETASSLYANSPDVNDNLWSSFSMDFDFSSVNESFPAFNSNTETIALTHSSDKLQWYWGMKYTNLTATWWDTDISPANHTYSNKLRAMTTYDELTFTYNLTLSPDTHQATLTENYTVGKIRNLWVFWGWPILPLYNHYNATGCYRYGKRISDETVYDYIQNNQIKMSIIEFQRCVLLDHNTYSVGDQAQNATDTDAMLNDSITTYTDDNEKIFQTNFNTKETYKLYDPTDTSFTIWNSTTRTSKLDGFAKNTNLFAFHVDFMKFVPLAVAFTAPSMYQKVKDTLANMSWANSLYIIAYPVYNGCKIEHDPTFTAYLTFTTVPEFPTVAMLPFLMAIVALGVLYARKKARSSLKKSLDLNVNSLARKNSAR